MLAKAMKNSYLAMALLFVLVVLCAYFRVSGLELRPLSIDEATIVSFIQGVVAKGYPYVVVSTMEVPLATYELIPYFLTIPSLFTGEVTEFTVRLPSVIFSVGTMIMIFMICFRQFGLFSAVVSCVLYSTSTWAIYWGQNAFHPAPTQFFTLLTVVLIQRLLSQNEPTLKLSLAVWLSFTFTYLSWEGSGFLLPVAAVIVLYFKRDNLLWIFNRNLLVMYALVILTLVWQGVRRIMLQEPHLMLGSGKGDISLPQLGFLNDSWDPLFYLINFFGMETHLLVGLVFVVGFYYFLRLEALRYFYLFFILTVLFLSNFLLFYNAHYLYFIYPFFIISVGVIISNAVQDGYSILKRDMSPITLGIGLFASAFFLLTVFASINSNFVQAYSIGNQGYLGVRLDYRNDLAQPDYRTVTAALEKNIREGDKVISMAPMPTRLYSGITSDYFLQTITDRKIVYDNNLVTPFYRDKFIGSVVLRNFDELKDLLASNERVWFVAAPYQSMPTVIDADTVEFIDSNFRVIKESYDARLYLWTR
ncbi:hypothetical protein CN03_07225 [Thalassolituus oleivorans]|uniref:glycosyltransferase family 39 protein n=1 Tax=Thalassolituus oleivorans TaxID=187493 RepID=UPI0009493115|nr:glycosyltransferase family 39 protein [Thalassolituus oleivorans]APR66745.1 hypothetical protein CN03_07225 [Thalassolituus oleivorans]